MAKNYIKFPDVKLGGKVASGQIVTQKLPNIEI